MNAPVRHVEIPDIEREILGLLLTDPGAIHGLGGKLTARHFSANVAAVTFETISAIAMSGSMVSPRIIREKIPRNIAEQYHPVPFDAVLASWMETAPSDGVTLDDLVSILAERVMRDDLIALSVDLKKAIANTGLDAGEIGVDFAERLEGLLSGVKPERYGSIGELARISADEVAKTFQSEKPVGYDFGIPEITKIMGFMAPGDLIVLGAPSGHGKTALATQIGLHVANQAPVLMIQGEMDGKAIAARLVNGAARVKASDIERGYIRQADVEAVLTAAQRYRLIPFDIDWRPAPTLERIKSRIKYAKHQRGGLGLVIVDHLKIVKPGRKTKDRFEAIAAVCEGLKEIAKDEGVAIVLLAQRTREAAKRGDLTFRISDLYGGGDIEENADSVLLLHMPHKSLIDMGAPHGQQAHDKWVLDLDIWKGMAEVICGKRRRGKPGGKAKIRWSGETTTFSSPDDDQGDLI